MSKYEQNAYKKTARPAGEPSASRNFRDASPRPQTVGPSRRIHRVADTSIPQNPPVKTPTEKVNKFKTK
jgi:hypothetical protein